MRCATAASLTSGGTSIWPPSNAMTPMAALLSAETVLMPRERSSRDAPASSLVPWACASAFFWSRSLLLGVELGETVDDLLGHRRSRLLRLSLGAVELLTRLVELGLPGLQLRRARRELGPSAVDLLLLGRELGRGLERVGDGADALDRAGAGEGAADRRALGVGERGAVGGVEHHRARSPAGRRQRRSQLVGDLGRGGAGDRDRGREGAVTQRIRTAGERQQGDPDHDDEAGATGAEATQSGRGRWPRMVLSTKVTVSGRR